MSKSQFNYMFTLKNIHLSLNSYNLWIQPNIVMKFAGYVAWILIYKRCKFGEKICYNSRDIEFFLGGYFFMAHPVYTTTFGSVFADWCISADLSDSFNQLKVHWSYFTWMIYDQYRFLTNRLTQDSLTHLLVTSRRWRHCKHWGKSFAACRRRRWSLLAICR